MRPFSKDVCDKTTGAVLARVFCTGEQDAPHQNKKAETFPSSSPKKSPKRKFQGEEKAERQPVPYVTSLDKALAWRESLQNELRRPFLVLAHEKPRQDYDVSRRTTRVYEVVCAALFLSRYAKRRQTNMLGWQGAEAMQSPVAWDRFVCEVLAGPCKLFFDLEFSTSTNAGLNGDDLQASLLRAVAAALQTQFAPPVFCTRTVVLDSSKPEKFSRHVIVTLDGGRTVFADGRDVGRFVRHVTGTDEFCVSGGGGSRIPFADGSVYNGRQPFRLYGAAKYTEPKRLMVLHGAATPWTSWERCDPDETVLAESMATFHGLSLLEATGTRFLTFQGSAGSELRQARVPSHEAGKACTTWQLPQNLVRALFSVPGIAECEPKSVVYKEQSQTAFISCEGKDCAMAGRAHASSTVYVHVDLPRAAFRVRCHSPNCAGGRLLPWRQFPAECKEAINEFLQQSVPPATMGREASALLLA